MTLTLPSDLAPHADFSRFHDPAVYALWLNAPDDMQARWDEAYDVRPVSFDLAEIESARRVVYVGATDDCLSRLEDHRDGDVRQTALTRVCELEGLRNVWFFDDADEAFEKESQLALMVANHHPELFVHQR